MPSFVRSFVRSFAGGLIPVRSSFVSFSSLWTAFTLTVHINAICNESIHGKEERAT